MNDIKVFGKRNKNETYVDRIGAYIIAEKDGCFAAVETPRGFFLIGGGIENNESHIDCIKRECLEETGRNVQIDGYLCSAEIFTVHDRLGPFHPVQYYYYGKLSDIVTVPIEVTTICAGCHIRMSVASCLFRRRDGRCKNILKTLFSKSQHNLFFEIIY